MHRLMNRVSAPCLLIALGAFAQAQETNPPPPKVINIYREYLKPGKAGAAHEKSESAFVQAAIRSKWPVHYLALTSITGRPRSLFLYAYDSFDGIEKDVKAEEKNAAYSAALEHALAADGELLSDSDNAMLVYNDEYSLRSAIDLPHMRYFQISLYRLRPGHDGDWDAIMKLVKGAYEKMPEVNWAMYHVQYGLEGNTYLVFVPLKSASDIDKSLMGDKQFLENLGEAGLKKLDELSASTIEATQTNLFSFSPKMSYVPDSWIKADPEFWKPKATMTAAPKKPTEKKAPAGQ
jgi:hypothetical protein